MPSIDVKGAMRERISAAAPDCVMLPKNQVQEYEHRKHKRQLEVRMMIESIISYLRTQPNLPHQCNIDVFEFGAGDGFQIPLLENIGNVITSDIYTSSGIKKLNHVKFLECSIIHAPFRNGQFEVIFASQVIPDLADIKSALKEAQRIGKQSCLYAFSVPTNIWLFLSLPALYYNKIRIGVQTYSHDSKLKKFLRTIAPEGRGRWNFLQCFHYYKIKNWKRLFIENGFSVLEIRPLLLYGPSEWPIIPTSRSTTNFCSSVLFLLVKRQNHLRDA